MLEATGRCWRGRWWDDVTAVMALDTETTGRVSFGFGFELHSIGRAG